MREKTLREFSKTEGAVCLSVDAFSKQLANLGGGQFIEDAFSSIVNLCNQILNELQSDSEDSLNSLNKEEQQLYSITR